MDAKGMSHNDIAREFYRNNSEYRESCKARSRARHKQLRDDPDYRLRRRLWNRKRHSDSKTKCLTAYGKNGRIHCCWTGCAEVDPDVLSIDHVDDNGAADKKNGRRKTGHTFYDYLIKNNFPSGFQTLCLNHQFKKELLRRRKIA